MKIELTQRAWEEYLRQFLDAKALRAAGLGIALLLCTQAPASGKPHRASKRDKQLSYISIGAVDQRAIAKVATMLRSRGIDTWGDADVGMFDVRVPPGRRREAMRLVRIDARKYGYYYVHGNFHVEPQHRSRM